MDLAVSRWILRRSAASACVLRLSKRVVGPALSSKKAGCLRIWRTRIRPGRAGCADVAQSASGAVSHCPGQRIATAGWFASREDLKSGGSGGSGRPTRREVPRLGRTGRCRRPRHAIAEDPVVPRDAKFRRHQRTAPVRCRSTGPRRIRSSHATRSSAATRGRRRSGRMRGAPPGA